jgi:hypothetical protein
VCQITPMSCAADSDCLSTWTCQLMNPASCACPSIEMSDGASPACVCPDASSSGKCIPPYWNGYGGNLSSNGGAPTTGDAGVGVGSWNDGSTDAADSGAGAPGGDAAFADGGDSTVEATTTSSSNRSNDNASGGCQIGPGRGSSSTYSFLAMALMSLGISLGRVRRAKVQRIR